MNAKQLERLVAEQGGNASAFDVVTRKLREAFHVSTGGRGINAHNLTVEEVAWLLGAYAGSDAAARAAHTLKRLMGLHSDERVNAPFLFNLQLIVRGEIRGVREIRICRNAELATIIYEDGREVLYTRPAHEGGVGKVGFRSEGVLTGSLLSLVAGHMRGGDEGDQAERTAEMA